ncbi:YveK family protein [Mycolicibacterium lacusdiani]|uniref:YveK family protein n=1 Tax=Mycolicibacterium lacusdiani TaxID=2895283 RepID=UPI001F2344B2|nr:cell shape-determining protein [Mycolicibacterium lacusdiani]
MSTSYLGLLRAKWRWLSWGVLLALAVTTAALVATPPLYRCEATLFVRTPGDVSSVVDGGDSYAQGRARTFAALADNSALTSRVVTDLGLELAPETLAARVDAENPPGTALIEIEVSSPTPSEARRTATVLLDELAATVDGLETVPGSLVPRAELVVVNPPSAEVRVSAWGLPVAAVLAGAALTGVLVGAMCVVLTSVRASAGRSSAGAESLVDEPARGVR